MTPARRLAREQAAALFREVFGTSPKSTRLRCAGIRENGSRCFRWPAAGSVFCHAHGPPTERRE